DGAVGELLEHVPFLAEPPGAIRRDPHPRHPGAPDLAVDQPLLLGEPLLHPLAGLERPPGEPRLLHPVEPEVTGVVAAEVVAAEVPALRPAHELVRLDLA